MNALNHVPASTPVSEIVEHLQRDNYVIVDSLAPTSLMDAIDEEVAPHVAATEIGYNVILGKKMRRTGALIARSPSCRTLIQHRAVLGVCESFLSHASAFQLMLTQIISIEPGESAQGLHRDQVAWDFFPFPSDYHVQCNMLWALSDYTAEMGATRVVPGSHLPDALTAKDYTDADCLQAEMSRGSVLIYSGKIVQAVEQTVPTRFAGRSTSTTRSDGCGRRRSNTFRYQWKSPRRSTMTC